MVKDSIFGPQPIYGYNTLAGRLQRGKGECLREVLASRSCASIYDVICNSDFEDRRELPEYFGRIILAIDGDAVALIQEADRIYSALDPAQDYLVTPGGRRVDMLVRSVIEAGLRGHRRSRQAVRFAFASSGVWEHVLGDITFRDAISDHTARELLGPWPKDRIEPAVSRFGDFLQRWAKWEPSLAITLERQPGCRLDGFGEECKSGDEEPMFSDAQAAAVASTPGFITNEAAALKVLKVMRSRGESLDSRACTLLRMMALEHASRRVRSLAGHCLGRVTGEDLESALLSRLRGEDPGFSDGALGAYLEERPFEVAVGFARRIQHTPGVLGKVAIGILSRYGDSGDLAMMRRELAYAMEQCFDHRQLLILRAWPTLGGRSDDPLLREVYEKASWLGARHEAFQQMRESLTDVWRESCSDALWDASEGIRRLACTAFREVPCPVPERLREIASDSLATERERSDAREALGAQ